MKLNEPGRQVLWRDMCIYDSGDIKEGTSTTIGDSCACDLGKIIICDLFSLKRPSIHVTAVKIAIQ